MKLCSRRMWAAIASSSASPPTRIEREVTMPPSAITATSVVPPPMSTISCPTGSPTGSPVPIAAAIGSAMRSASRAPASWAASSTARRSSGVRPEGTQTITRGRPRRPSRARAMKCRSICWVTPMSWMTPSRRGRVAVMVAGVRPSIRRASAPTATTSPVRSSIATTEGSVRTIPCPRR